jgi:hypothetical protein
MDLQCCLGGEGGAMRTYVCDFVIGKGDVIFVDGIPLFQDDLFSNHGWSVAYLQERRRLGLGDVPFAVGCQFVQQ